MAAASVNALSLARLAWATRAPLADGVSAATSLACTAMSQGDLLRSCSNTIQAARSLWHSAVPAAADAVFFRVPLELKPDVAGLTVGTIRRFLSRTLDQASAIMRRVLTFLLAHPKLLLSGVGIVVLSGVAYLATKREIVQQAVGAPQPGSSGAVEAPDASAAVRPDVMEPPQALCCPITTSLFEDPVIIESGQTYEREAIENWFRHGNTSCPLTRSDIPQPPRLIRNFALAATVDDYRRTLDRIATA